MRAHEINLLADPGILKLHNAAQSRGQLEFLTDTQQWGYSLSFPVTIPPPPEPELQPLIIVGVQVLAGSVGVGVVDERMQHFVTSEVDVPVSAAHAQVELPMDADGARHIMVRNIASGNVASCFRLVAAVLRFVRRNDALLVPRTAPHVEEKVHEGTSVSGTFDILISHSSRLWFAEQCDLASLRARYSKPDRLAQLPPFDSLPPQQAPYYGLLTAFRVELSAGRPTGQVLRHYVSPEKVVHAAVMSRQLVVCFDGGIAMFDVPKGGLDRELDAATCQRIVDPWFGGLHTVMPVDRTTCLVSSAGADAVLWLDTSKKAVARRWRLPSDRYGTNYALDDTMSLAEHYIPNDFQLGHLNCASPDGRGGAFFSVLGQGDVGHMRASGECEVLVTGHVGCHGIRYETENDLLYFCDSCRGRLIRVDGQNLTTRLFDAGSRWLHDAVHLSGGLFLLTLGDQNRLVLADTNRGRLLAEWDFSAAGGSIQFLSVVSPNKY